MEPNNPVTPAPVINNGAGVVQKDKSTKWKVITAVMAVIAICGASFGVYEIFENNKTNDEIKNLQAEIAALKEQGQSTEKEDTPSDDTPVAKKYLEPEGWNVRFAYPDGVTDMKAGVNNDNYDGALYIWSITKDGKTYDVNICGGEEGYRQYAFILGTVERWNPKATHESWQKSPGEYDGMDLILTNGDYMYYVNAFGGNGCETGDDTPDYVEAVNIAKTLLNGIEAK